MEMRISTQGEKKKEGKPLKQFGALSQEVLQDVFKLRKNIRRYSGLPLSSM